MNLRSTIYPLLLSTCLALTGTGTGAANTLGDLDDNSWKFRVYLNDKEIGYHHFNRTELAQAEQIDITAEFKVKFLFVTAFSYRHDNREIWQDSCLKSIESETLTNGDREAVSGSREASGLRIETLEEAREAPGCVRTFAYWDRNFLSAQELLNSQTGELMPVTVESLASRPVPFRGAEVQAESYRLTGGDLDLKVYYVGDRWVGLESIVEGGRTLRYEMI